jgi:hypothetical protein
MGHKEVQNLVSLSAAALLSQDCRQMEASYATELQWAGEDKWDTVACEVVLWVKWKRIVVRGEGTGVYILMDYMLTKWSKI